MRTFQFKASLFLWVLVPTMTNCWTRKRLAICS